MVGRLNHRRAWLVALALAVAWGAPQLVAAQGSNGKVDGVVKDSKGEPVDGATVVFQPATGRKIETKTNKQGQYSYPGVPPGDYTLGATKGTTLMSVPTTARVNPGATVTTEIVVLEKKDAEAAMAAAAATAKADAAKLTEFKAAFDAGAAAANAGNHDEAIAKFTQAATANPKCSDCYSNLGYAYLQKKDYDKAETAYNKSNEIKPNAASYSGLASVYTATKKLDQASAASAKASELSASAGGAAGGGNADALFNQGVTLWNSGKIEDAKKQFQAALQVNPNHAGSAFPAGDGAGQRRESHGSGDRVRDVPETRADRPQRADREVAA